LSLVRDDPRLAGIAIDVEASDVELTLDREQMKLTLLNLLLNAGQAQQPQGGSVRIECDAGPDGSRIRVVDAGPGIPAPVRDHLFEPFFTTKSRGTGLGLVTARRIVELHGGTLTVCSPDGGGTVATIRLPPSVV
jgi:signal transduction histidine kinase